MGAVPARDHVNYTRPGVTLCKCCGKGATVPPVSSRVLTGGTLAGSPLGAIMPAMRPARSTTILSVRRGADVALGGDGQVTLGQIVAKADAVKIRRIGPGGKVLTGFAGSAADAFALLERFEKKLAEFPDNTRRAVI